MMSVLICPVCSLPLERTERSFKCENGHSFDSAREGYVNLLLANQRSSKNPGDSPEMAVARRAFLSKGYYCFLAEKLAELTDCLTPQGGVVLDACCGEGYYTDIIQRHTCRAVYAFDISKTMIRLAAKRNGDVTYFVAGLNSIPAADGSVDTLVHIFAPFNEQEFSRILSDGGRVISVSPGREHLFGLKKLLYDSPYYNEEKPEGGGILRVCETIRLKRTIELHGSEDITALFKMTPYYYKTSQNTATLLSNTEWLETEADFLITIYEKQSEKREFYGSAHKGSYC